MKNDCLFCAIIDDELPSYKIYEDDLFYVMLDRFPKCMGHTLILAKRHASSIFALNEAECAGLMPLVQRVSNALLETFKFDGINLLQNNGATAGQEVMHFHLHLIPRFEDDAMAIQYKRIDPSDEDFKAVLEKMEKIKI